MTDSAAETEQQQNQGQQEQGQTVVVPQKEAVSETEDEKNDREKEELRRMLSAESDEDNKGESNSDTNSNSGSEDDSDDSDDDSDSDDGVTLTFPEDDKSVTPKKPFVHPKGPSPFPSKLSAPVAALGIDVANGYLPGYLPPTSGVVFNHLFYFEQIVSRLEGISQESDRLEEKPWNKPGADIRDFFNYGFNDKMWEAYLKKQKALRSMDFSSPPPASSISTANSNLSKALSIPTSSSGSSDGINLTYSQAPSSFNNKGGTDNKKKGADGKPLFMMEPPPMTLMYGPGAMAQKGYYEQGLLPHMHPTSYHMGNSLMPTPSFQTLPSSSLPLKTEKRDSDRSDRSDRDRTDRSGGDRDRSDRDRSDRKDRDRSGSDRDRSERRSTSDRDRSDRGTSDRDKSDRHRDKDHDRDRGSDRGRDRGSDRSSGSSDKRDRSTGSKRSTREFASDAEPDKKRKRDA